MKKLVAAQLWYTPEQYPEVKAMMEDGHLLPGLHAQWLEGAEQREEQVRGKGGVAVRVPFDPAEFRSFCSHFRVALDTKSRSHFAALKAQHMQRDSH